MIKLVIPTIALKEKALEYQQKHFDNREYVINGSEFLDKTDSYEGWLKKITANTNTDTVSPDCVLIDTFFTVEEETGDIVDIIDFRHTLDDFLINFGNCSYSVRLSKRNKGYIIEML